MINAAAALAAYAGPGNDDNVLHEALAAGLEQARSAINSGAAAALLERWVSYSTAKRVAERG